jgi:ribosomal protein S18 acetylase RimI-like enzyme
VEEANIENERSLVLSPLKQGMRSYGVGITRVSAAMIMYRRYQWVSFNFVFLLLFSCWNNEIVTVEALLPADGIFAASALPWLRKTAKSQPISPSTTDELLVSKSTTIRIQKTVESDLADIASFLAAASQSSRPSNNAWMSKIDFLFAKSDIETLIRRRWRILHKGHLAYMRVKKQLQALSVNGNVEGDINPPTHQLIKYLWSTNEDLRQELQIAASETGEDTIWNHHQPMVLTPSTGKWFNHLQMSATAKLPISINNLKKSETAMPKKAPTFPFLMQTEDRKTEQNCDASRVVGFCEIAMLSNPVYDTISSPNPSNDCIISIVDSKDRVRFYSPAIANLAVATDMRRRGIASRLLRCAERYVAAHWEHATALGLYVSASNLPAISLYEKCGYTRIIETSLSTEANGSIGDGADTMWYMSKSLRRSR